MRVSIIVATRNPAHAITGFLDSIAATLAHAAPLDAEIVVVDNGSHDTTSAIVEQWASASPFPVRQLFEPRKGLSAARKLRSTSGARRPLGVDRRRLTLEEWALRCPQSKTDPSWRIGGVFNLIPSSLTSHKPRRGPERHSGPLSARRAHFFNAGRAALRAERARARSVDNGCRPDLLSSIGRRLGAALRVGSAPHPPPHPADGDSDISKWQKK